MWKALGLEKMSKILSLRGLGRIRIKKKFPEKVRKIFFRFLCFFLKKS